MKYFSKATKRKITLLDEDNDYYYFIWDDTPDHIHQWSKKNKRSFEDYFKKEVNNAKEI